MTRLKTLGTRIQSNKAMHKVQSVSNRLRGSSWIAVKKSFELHNPRLCAQCDKEGKVGNGDELDHIVPLSLGGSNAADNLQWLCHEHHTEKTSKEAEERNKINFLAF